MSYWEELKPGAVGGVVINVLICIHQILLGDDRGKHRKRQILINLEPGRKDKSLGNAGLWKSDCEAAHFRGQISWGH